MGVLLMGAFAQCSGASHQIIVDHAVADDLLVERFLFIFGRSFEHFLLAFNHIQNLLRFSVILL